MLAPEIIATSHTREAHIALDRYLQSLLEEWITN
jgi:hypothetical protein